MAKTAQNPVKSVEMTFKVLNTLKYPRADVADAPEYIAGYTVVNDVSGQDGWFDD